jgi:hypothetical protein
MYRSFRPAWPILSGFCLLSIILFLMAVTLVLSLIPLYTNKKSITPMEKRKTITFNVKIEPNTIVETGSFNAKQRALLQSNVSII